MSAIERALGAFTDSGEIPGIVATAGTASGEIASVAVGARRLGEEAPMSLDTVFRIASMTKAVTSVAALQQVERGLVSLDEPIGRLVPELQQPMLIEGFDAEGNPRLRPSTRPITLRHLLSHTSGFAYDTWNPLLLRYVRSRGLKRPMDPATGAIDVPMVTEPGTRWEYSVSIDWAGRMVENLSGLQLEEYFQRHIFAPLGMRDTTYAPTPGMVERLATTHQRSLTGALAPRDPELPRPGERFFGGGGLFSTAPDYLKFLQALLRGGEGDHGRILSPETIQLANTNQIGDLDVNVMISTTPERSNDASLLPEMTNKWGLMYMLATADAVAGRSAGSGAWAGIANTYYWIDPRRDVAGVFMSQILPFADPTALRAFADFERAVYDELR
jgi:CubicO group peptidase (beta-lactamase class C family)